MQFRKCLMVVTLMLTAGAMAPVRAEEQPVAPTPLAIHAQAKMPAKLDMGRIEKLVDAFLQGDEAARAAADADLMKSGPLCALTVQARAQAEKDSARQEQLAALLKRLLADRRESADLLFQYAQAMSTVSKGEGPLDFDASETWRLRAIGKVFFACFLDPQHYGDRLENQLSQLTPYLDLPAAAAVYRCAGGIYDRLASAGTDASQAAADRARAEECRKLADAAAGLGGRVK